jgi:hypothetical protein
VAISAKMHVGKTTLADMLVERFGYVRASFASSLKEYLTHLGLPLTRANMQAAGQGGRDILGEGIWIMAFMRRYGEHPRIVVDDMRYQNEYEFLLGNNATMVRLTAGLQQRWERYKTSDKFVKGLTRTNWAKRLDHPTETQLDGDKFHWDVTIDTSRRTPEQVFDQLVSHGKIS